MLSLTRPSDSYPSLDASQEKKNKKNSNFSHSRPSCQLPAAASTLSVKTQGLVTRELQIHTFSLMQVQKKMIKKLKLLTLTGTVASCCFKPECQNSSSCYQELQKQAPTFMQVKKKIKKKTQTSHTHRASC
jgi:hypothetical protein